MHRINKAAEINSQVCYLTHGKCSINGRAVPTTAIVIIPSVHIVLLWCFTRRREPGSSEVIQGSHCRAGPSPPPPRQRPGDGSNLLDLLLVRANLCKSGISRVLALSPLGHMLLNDSCLTAFAGGTRSFQPKFDKRTFLLSVLLSAICHCGMVPSLDRQDAEIGPPRKLQRQRCHQRAPVGREAPRDPSEPGLGLLGPHLQEQDLGTRNHIPDICFPHL